MLPPEPTTADIVVVFGSTLTPPMIAAYHAANEDGVNSEGMVKFVRQAEDFVSLTSYRYFDNQSGRDSFAAAFVAASQLYFAEYPDTEGTFVEESSTVTDEEYNAVVGNVSLVTFLYEG
jgi:hypothetical protein